MRTSHVLLSNHNATRLHTSASMEERSSVKRQRVSPIMFEDEVLKPRAADFVPLRVLGHGAFGMVQEVAWKGQRVAVKTTEKAYKLGMSSIKTEAYILKQFAHPFIVPLVGVVVDDQFFHVMMQFCRGGDLFHRLQTFGSSPDCMKHMRFYLAEIVAGVHFLHSRNILYGDLKLENIMIDGEGHVRLVDFNMSVLGVSAGCKSVHGPRGSKYSQAPEQVRGAAYGLKTDVWALGCVAFEMFLKTHVSKSSLEDFAANELTTTDPVLDDFIKCLLVRDADARPSMEDVKKHELFQAVEWADVEQKRLPVPWMPPDDCFHFDKELQELDPFPLFEDVNKLRFVVVPRME